MAAINEIMSGEEEQPSPPQTPVSETNTCAREGDKQVRLRKAIVEIQSDKNIDGQEKSRRIQALMCSDSPLCSPARTSAAEVEAGTENDTTEDEFAISFHDEAEGVLGCAHYPRQAKIRAPCCGKYYTCRLCHDAHQSHKIDRYAIKTMMCMHCKTVQPCAQFCKNEECGKKLAKYYCDICHLFSDADKSIFHCKDCGLCRVGKGLGIDYKHCTKCGSCINLSIFDDHVCLENALHSNCPICAEHMFTSVKPVCILKCGHYMHLQCLDDYTQRDYRCPICKKSLGDMSNRWRQIDDYMVSNPMPEEYKDKMANILCYDCGKYSDVPYHFVYHRCGHEECGSYNTTIS